MITVLRKLRLLFIVCSLPCAISKRSCFGSIVHSYDTNFAEILLKIKSSDKMKWTDPILMLTSFVSSLIVIRLSCITKVFTWSITISFLEIESLSFTSYRFAAIFEMVVPLHLNIAFNERLFYRVDCFCLGIANHYTKFNEITFFKFFCHFLKIKIRQRSLTVPLSFSVCQWLSASTNRTKFKHAY